MRDLRMPVYEVAVVWGAITTLVHGDLRISSVPGRGTGIGVRL